MSSIKNTSTKIVNIGTYVLMPNDTVPVTRAIERFLTAPSIKAMVERGQLEIIENATVEADAPVEEKKPKKAKKTEAAEQ